MQSLVVNSQPWVAYRPRWNRRSLHSRIRHIRSQQQPETRLVTFLGKGGSGKSISALLAAQYYARLGLRTCLAVQSQDPTIDLLLGQKIGGTSVSLIDGALDVLRLETTKLLLEPLAQIKKADARLNFSQGALDEIAGEEISVLPGMDSLFALGAMEGLIGFAGNVHKAQLKSKPAYDVVVYDGLSSEETLRLLGAAEKLRWYLQRARSLAEKTDTGRVTSPSVLRLIEASLTQESGSDTTGRSTAEIWDGVDRVLEKITQAFAETRRFACYLVVDPSNPFSIDAAMRYWGCAMQSGVRVAGALYAEVFSSNAFFKEKFVPLEVACFPTVNLSPGVAWEGVIARLNKDVKALLMKDNQKNIPEPVKYNVKEQMVTFFLPGFQKSEIKLSQWRAGTALLIEVGDQRRVVTLPSGMRGKVGGAKFEDNRLTVSIKAR